MNDLDEPSASEVRIRREIRAAGWPLAAQGFLVAGAIIATNALGWAIYMGLALACLARWHVERPRLPGNEPWTDLRPWWWLIVIGTVAGIALAVGLTDALTGPGRWWSWPLAALGAVLSAAFFAVIVIGRRNYKRDRRAERTRRSP